jgi:hypothetical protein
MPFNQRWEPSVGEVVLINTGRYITTDNALGGTCILETFSKPFRIQVTKHFEDYETGVIVHGRVLDADVAADIRKEAGRTDDRPVTIKFFRDEVEAAPAPAR